MYQNRSLTARMLGRALGVAGALTVATLAHAAGGPGPRGALTGDTLYSNDSDHFSEVRTNLGYLFANGWGLGASASYFNAADSVAKYGRGLYGQYRLRDRAQTLDARLGVMDTNGHTTPTGSVDYMRHLTAATSLGLSAERDVVDSTVGLDKGLTYDSAALVLDHQFTPRFSVGAVAGAMWFSDDNARAMLRTRWNYEVLANSGLNAYIKTRAYSDSNPAQGNYYSPRWLAEYSGGLSWRTALGQRATFFASADLGRQNTDGGGATNIWGARVGLENHRSRTVQWQLAVETTNDHAAGFAGGGDGYRYTSVTGRLMIPLR